MFLLITHPLLRSYTLSSIVIHIFNNILYIAAHRSGYSSQLNGHWLHCERPTGSSVPTGNAIPPPLRTLHSKAKSGLPESSNLPEASGEGAEKERTGVVYHLKPFTKPPLSGVPEPVYRA